MAEANVIVGAKFVYVKAGTDLPLPGDAAVDLDFVGAGWTKLENLTEEGADLKFIYEMLEVRPMGSKRPTQLVPKDAGIEMLTVNTYEADAAAWRRALPDPLISGPVSTGGGTITYYTGAVVVENGIWRIKRMLATGDLNPVYKNDAFTFSKYAYTCLEDPDATTPGDPNWEFEPIL